MPVNAENVNESPGGLDMGDEITAVNAVAKHCTWLALEGKSGNTIASRHGALHRCAAAAAPALLADATTDDLLRWRMTLLKAADNYVLAQVSHVRCFFSWLCEHEYRPDNPARRLPVPRKPSGIPHPIGESELLAALENAPPRIRLWLLLAAYCGLRACEIALLRRVNIRENGDRPHIRIAPDATKGRYEAVVPLDTFMTAEIRAARLPSTGHAFRRLDGQPGPVSPHRVSALCNQYLHSLGYAETLHSLRHYFGTETLRAANGNVRTAQRALRHRRLDTTAVYTLVTDDEVAAAVAAIPKPRRLRAARGVAVAVAAAMLTTASAPALSPGIRTRHVHRRPVAARRVDSREARRDAA